jgi:trk system potassium uptake protein TrkH
MEQILKVTAISVLTVLTLMAGMFFLTISNDGKFIDLLFEATSALCTVGVSRGLTAQFDGLGRTVLMLLMFIGRVGPLTLGFFLATQATPRLRYPAGQVYLG